MKSLVFKVIGGIALLMFISFLCSWPIYMLWNSCLVGAVQGVAEVSWPQAWGITVLSGLLFKNNSVSKD